jgi:hypothetical protein
LPRDSPGCRKPIKPPPNRRSNGLKRVAEDAPHSGPDTPGRGPSPRTAKARAAAARDRQRAAFEQRTMNEAVISPRLREHAPENRGPRRKPGRDGRLHRRTSAESPLGGHNPSRDNATIPTAAGPSAKRPGDIRRARDERDQRRRGAGPPNATTVTWGLGVAPR